MYIFYMGWLVGVLVSHLIFCTFFQKIFKRSQKEYYKQKLMGNGDY